MRAALEYWWAYTLTPRTRVDVICFTTVTLLVIIGSFVIIKMKLPVWKFQIVWIWFMELLGVLLLVSRLAGA